MFVAPDSHYENGCLSSSTKKALLEAEEFNEESFDVAKNEVAYDIWMNSKLRNIVENQFSLLTDKKKPQTVGFIQRVRSFRLSVTEAKEDE
jgi:hypothetical protein